MACECGHLPEEHEDEIGACEEDGCGCIEYYEETDEGEDENEDE